MSDSQHLQFHVNPLSLVNYKDPGTLVDVGANIGYQLRLFLQVPGAHVVAYEPQRFLYLKLCQDINNAYSETEWPPEIEIHNIALSNFNGRVEMRAPVFGNHVGHEGASIVKQFTATQTPDGTPLRTITNQVQVMTLDSQNLQNVKYLKIDAEGAEEEILRGGVELLRAQKPTINIELEQVHRAGCVADVTSLLGEFGYTGYFIYHDKLHTMSAFKQDLHQVCETDGVGAYNRLDPYVFDFQFVHQDDAWVNARLMEIYGEPVR